MAIGTVARFDDRTIIVLSEVSRDERQSHLQFRADVQGCGGHSVSAASEHLWQENQKS